MATALQFNMCLIALLAALALRIWNETTHLQQEHHPLTKCSIKTVDAASLPPSELAALLAASTEPLIVRGVGTSSSSAFNPCQSLAGCLERYGDMVVGLSTSTAIGSLNPERALDATWQSGRREMGLRDYASAMGGASLPADTYVFFPVKGTRMVADYAAQRDLFGRVLALQQPALSRLAERLPALADILFNVTMRVALGGISTGSSWHSHGPALLSVSAGSKTWFIRPPDNGTRDKMRIPAWLDQTLRDIPGQPPQSTLAWVQAAEAARPRPSTDAPFKWLDHIWHCTQEAGEMMYVPSSLRHAIYNIEATYAVGVQVDMQVMGRPLHVAAFHGFENAAQLLLDEGADVHAQAANGGTPLHHASFFGHIGVARLLLLHGARIDVTDMRGSTPLDVAGSPGMAELLREFGTAQR